MILCVFFVQYRFEQEDPDTVCNQRCGRVCRQKHCGRHRSACDQVIISF